MYVVPYRTHFLHFISTKIYAIICNRNGTPSFLCQCSFNSSVSFEKHIYIREREGEQNQYLLSAKNESQQKWPVCQVNKKEGHTVSIYVCNLLSLAKSKFTNNQTQGHSWPSVYTHQSIN